MNFREVSEKYQIILASSSPRRKKLLTHLGIHFTVRTKEQDEEFPESLRAGEISAFLCVKKSQTFLPGLLPGEVLITADTIVWSEGRALNKPSGEEEAFEMLSHLSGCTHEVFTSFCLTGAGISRVRTVRSAVTFRKLDGSFIREYLRHCRPYDKAGSYGAQDFMKRDRNACSPEERGFIKRSDNRLLEEDCYAEMETAKEFDGIEKIEGSYFNVMGLPVVEVAEELEKLGEEMQGG